MSYTTDSITPPSHFCHLIVRSNVQSFLEARFPRRNHSNSFNHDVFFHRQHEPTLPKGFDNRPDVSHHVRTLHAISSPRDFLPRSSTMARHTRLGNSSCPQVGSGDSSSIPQGAVLHYGWRSLDDRPSTRTHVLWLQRLLCTP